MRLGREIIVAGLPPLHKLFFRLCDLSCLVYCRQTNTKIDKQKYWFCLNIYFWLWIVYIIIKFFQNWTTLFLNHPIISQNYLQDLYSQICLIKDLKYVGFPQRIRMQRRRNFFRLIFFTFVVPCSFTLFFFFSK